MKTPLKRRDFILKSAKAGIAGCALLYGARLYGADKLNSLNGEDKPDPKKLNYCGYTCPPDCRLKKATLDNDTDLKKQAYKDWRIEEKQKASQSPRII